MKRPSREKNKREVWVQSASVVPKRNNGLLTLCYIWVRSGSVVPKRNNGLMTHCYIWVRSASVVPKRNNWSFIYCYVWAHLVPIVPKLHVGVSMVWILGMTEKISYRLISISHIIFPFVLPKAITWIHSNDNLLYKKKMWEFKFNPFLLFIVDIFLCSFNSHIIEAIT